MSGCSHRTGEDSDHNRLSATVTAALSMAQGVSTSSPEQFENHSSRWSALAGLPEPGYSEVQPQSRLALQYSAYQATTWVLDGGTGWDGGKVMTEKKWEDEKIWSQTRIPSHSFVSSGKSLHFWAHLVSAGAQISRDMGSALWHSG